VSLVDIQGSQVVLSFGGGCQGCGMVDVTLKDGVMAQLTQHIPEITEVLDVTDHASGENPYYA
jgi:Fe/S biogenesis protein NfuA